MRHRRRSGSTWAVGRNLRLLTLIARAAFAAMGLMAGAASAKQAKPAQTVWLCRPGHVIDPCTAPLTTTVVQTNGETGVEKAKAARKAPIDCFYVYPTVSEQQSENSNLEIEPEETQIAIDQ